MADSLNKQSQGDAMNIPPGIDRISTKDGDCHYRVRIRIKVINPYRKLLKISHMLNVGSQRHRRANQKGPLCQLFQSRPIHSRRCYSPIS